MKFFYFLSLALIFLGCDVEPPQENNYEVRADVTLVNEISHKVAKQLKEKYGLVACGTGSQMMDKVKMVALSFKYYKPVDIEKARELLLAATNEMIKAVNDDVRIRPYLHEYPFSPKNVEIRIFAYNEDGSALPSTDLSIFAELEGNLDYQTFNRQNGFLLKTILQETHQQAELKQAVSKYKAS